MILQRRLHSIKLLCLAVLVAACNDTPPANTASSSAIADDMVVPAIMSYDIVNQYPHDPSAFTEGLQYRDGFLFEGTGQYGESEVRKVELTTGKVLQSSKMEPRYFGEGITILNGKIYQLTYREGKGFVYNLETLKQESSFTCPTQEGWGMTNNGTHLIFDDGGNVLYFLDPTNYTIVKRLEVTDERGPVNNINELELINGFIYANQWQTELILKIDTTTGKVVARADLASLRQRAGIPAPNGRVKSPEVLNGIAYDKEGNRIFVTGKNWPKLFEIRLSN